MAGATHSRQAGGMRAAALAVLAGAAVVLAPTSQGQAIELTGNVGPGFSISLSDATGARVTHLDPGIYTIVVNDRADVHNFHLSGLGVNTLTDLDTVETVTWTVTFQDGIYTYLCDAHRTLMRGRFAVGSASLTPPAPAVVPKLSGSIAARKIALTNSAGRRVAKVKAGKYRIAVKDLSRAGNFHLTGPGVNRKTGVLFKGTVTWTVNLKAGRYVYRSDKSAKLRGVLVVTAAAGAAAAHAGHAR